MLKENSTIIRRAIIAADLALLFGAFVGAFFVRFQRLPGNRDWEIYGWVALVFIPTLVFNLYRFGFYHRLRFLALRQIVRRLAISFFIAFGLTSALLFLSHATHYSRLLFIYFTGFSLLLVTCGKLGGKLLIDQIRRRGANFRSVLLVGRNPKLKRLQEVFKPGNPYGLKIAGIVNLENENPDQSFSDLLTTTIVDEVYFAIPRKPSGPGIDNYLEQAEAAGKTCKIVLNINENRISKCEFSHLEELPLVILHPFTLDPDQLLIKRLLDLCGGLAGMAFTLIFLPFIAIAIKLDSPGPIFFRQSRVGENGRIFTLYKYRSMYIDAEKQKSGLTRHNEMNGPVFKITADPRITRIGRFLRRTSLDELPQFWNVLRGEMSLVGTRPPTLDEVEKYDLHHYRRLSIKPGITGLWQVSGRNRIRDFNEIVKLDIKYIDQWSLWLDIKILLKTFHAIWSGK